MRATYVALLRGINVGGKNKLPMSDLKEFFVAAGCTDVRTYIQSGNVVFTADEETFASLAEAVAQQIAERFGYRTPVILRTAGELRDVVTRHPFLAAGIPEDSLYVYFLADAPSTEQIATLDPDRSPPDVYTVEGKEIYAHFPNGIGQTKLTNDYFDRKLATVSTARNWRTVTKLLEMAEG